MDDRFDLITASDLRYPGGTAASIAEEVRAQAAAGYRSGLLQLRAERLNALRPFNPRIQACLQQDLATFVPPGRRVRTKLLVLRHPSVFARPQGPLAHVEADRVVMVVNQPPADGAGDRRYYDLAAVRGQLEDAFGDSLVWAPIGPRVRASVLERAPGLGVTDSDWHNVIDPDEWRVDRASPLGRRPIIGRHSRPDWRKWPADRKALLAAYPISQDVRVRILGSGRALRRQIGRTPANWTLLPYNSISAKRFLAGIDFFVYFTHPGWIEAFGRSILESLASGAVALLPPVFEPLFGPACTYCEPHQVEQKVAALHRDWPAYQRQSAAGLEAVGERFSHARHAERVRELIGPPAGSPRRVSARPPSRSRRVLMMSSNGSGIGHLTRLLAMARRAPQGLEPIFLTLSRGLPLVRQQGFLVEHLPSAPALGISSEQWTPLIRARVLDLLRTYDPQAVVFDGTVPYWGLVQALREQPGRAFIWSRRAMWRQGSQSVGLERSQYFDLIIEPGELAGEVDRGATVPLRPGAVCVDPVLMLDSDELLDRARARAELGLAPTGQVFLIQLGAGNINSIQPIVTGIVERLGRVPNTEVVFLRSPIAYGGGQPGPDIRTVSGYPFGRYYRAFDGVFSAAGYNSFHELLAAGVPTVFVPNQRTAIDDQAARARFAADTGLGWCIDGDDSGAIDEAVDRVLDPEQRRGVSERCAELKVGEGARQAMAAVAGQLRRAEREAE